MNRTCLVQDPPALGPRPGLELVTIAHVCRALGLSRQGVHNRIAAGTLDPMPVGQTTDPKQLLWRRADINAAIARKNSNGN